MKSAPMPVQLCPWCGAVGDSATSRQGATPKAGDWSLCLECAAISRFDATLHLHVAAPAELVELSRRNWPFFRELINAQAIMRRHIKARPPAPAETRQ
jgi:hypothetical protein